MSVFFDEPVEKYHSQSGVNLSSHLLISAHRDLDEWRKRMVEPRADTPAFAFGRAAHTHCIEGMEAFEAEYIVGGPQNTKTGKEYGSGSKAFQEWASMQKNEAITTGQFGQISRMSKSVHANKAAAKLLGIGKAEQVARVDYCGLPCQIRVDWIREDAWLVDYKTTGDMFSFSSSVKQYGYMFQAAFYQAIATKILGRRLPFYLIACEKSKDAPCAVWELDQGSLNRHCELNMDKIIEIAQEFREINANRPDLSQIEQSVEEFRELVVDPS